MCLQELRAHHDDVPKSLRAPRKCTAAFHPAQRKGYAGVGVYARAPAQFANGFGSSEFDGEGRYLRADFRDVTVISLYLPSGSSGPHRQASNSVFSPNSCRILRNCAGSSAKSSCAATGTSRTSRSI